MSESLMGHVYVFLFPNGKRYVGQTIRNIEERTEEHWNPSKREYSFPVHCAIRKYGSDNVKIEHIFSFKCTQEYLNLMEDRSIVAFNALAPNGYNLRRGGSHGALDEETKRKISMTLKGREKPFRTVEHRSRISASNQGRKHSEETRAKMSANSGSRGKPGYWKGKPGTMTGRHHTPEARVKMSIARRKRPNPMTGKHHSEEVRSKMSAARKGRPGPMKGRHHSAETKAKISVIKRERKDKKIHESND